MTSYKACFSYIKKNKNYFIAIFLIFFITLLAGIFYQPAYLEKYVRELISSLADKIAGMNFFQLLGYIWQNNIITAFLGMFYGLFLGLFSLFTGAINGYILGFVMERVGGSEGFLVIFNILPHGIFEIPALILSLGLGLKLGFSVIEKFVEKYKNKKFFYFIFLTIIFPFIFFVIMMVANLANKKMRKELWFNIKNCIAVFFYIIVPLLIIAGIIETGFIFIS